MGLGVCQAACYAVWLERCLEPCLAMTCSDCGRAAPSRGTLPLTPPPPTPTPTLPYSHAPTPTHPPSPTTLPPLPALPYKSITAAVKRCRHPSPKQATGLLPSARTPPYPYACRCPSGQQSLHTIYVQVCRRGRAPYPRPWLGAYRQQGVPMVQGSEQAIMQWRRPP